MISQAIQQQDRWSTSPQWICVDGTITDTPPPGNCRIRKTAGGGGSSWNRITLEDKLSLQQKKGHTARRRRVTFNTNVTVRCVKSLKEYSERRFSVTFYSREEYKQIAEERKNEVKILSSIGNDSCDHRDICPRGIEHEAYVEVKQKKLSRRLNAKISLFDEQDFQYNTGSYDEMYLADAYSRYTREAADAAVLIAKEDAKEALSS